MPDPGTIERKCWAQGSWSFKIRSIAGHWHFYSKLWPFPLRWVEKWYRRFLILPKTKKRGTGEMKIVNNLELLIKRVFGASKSQNQYPVLSSQWSTCEEKLSVWISLHSKSLNWEPGLSGAMALASNGPAIHPSLMKVMRATFPFQINRLILNWCYSLCI